jgi:hypothetical protein
LNSNYSNDTYIVRDSSGKWTLDWDAVEAFKGNITKLTRELLEDAERRNAQEQILKIQKIENPPNVAGLIKFPPINEQGR